MLRIDLDYVILYAISKKIIDLPNKNLITHDLLTAIEGLLPEMTIEGLKAILKKTEWYAKMIEGESDWSDFITAVNQEIQRRKVKGIESKHPSWIHNK